MPAHRLLIELLGGLRISRDGGETIEIPTRQGGSVLAYLALNLQRKHGREELIDLFWPDDGLEEGPNKLRKSLTAIRDWLGATGVDPAQALLAGRSEIRLNPSAVVTDVILMEESLAQSAQSVDNAQRAHYLGEIRLNPSAVVTDVILMEESLAQSAQS